MFFKKGSLILIVIPDPIKGTGLNNGSILNPCFFNGFNINSQFLLL